MEQPGDLEDDGDVGTKRELEEECGGGIPPGLPPLIHIECCKSGKVSHVAVMSDTFFFMFEMVSMFLFYFIFLYYCLLKLALCILIYTIHC